LPRRDRARSSQKGRPAGAAEGLRLALDAVSSTPSLNVSGVEGAEISC